MWTAFRLGFRIAGKPFVFATPAFPEPNGSFYFRHVGDATPKRYTTEIIFVRGDLDDALPNHG